MTQPVTGSRPLPSQERRTEGQPERTSITPTIGWVSIREAHLQTGVPISTIRYWAREGHVESQLDLTGKRPRRLVALDEVIARVQRRGRPAPSPAPAPEPAAPAPPTPPVRTAAVTARDQRVPEGAMIVPIDAWNKMLNQLGNLHEAGRQLAEASERAARAETEAKFLRERLAELRGDMAELKEAAAPPQPPPAERDGIAPRWKGVYDRWWRRGR